MAKVDTIYNDLVKEIHEEGAWDYGEKVRTVYADGTPAHTKSIIGKQVKFEADVFPMITTKNVTYRSLFAEIWWIWLSRNNDTRELVKMGSSVWNSWRKDDGTIGSSYGYVLDQKVRNIDGVLVNQVDYLLNQLRDNPSSRRHIVSLWSPEHLDGGSLEPCVWSSQWIVQKGKLHLIVNQRSADLALGVVFNWAQYKLLQMIIAKLTGHEVGTMTWNFGHLHYYCRHQDKLLEQIKEPQLEQPIVELADKEELEALIHKGSVTKEDLESILTITKQGESKSYRYEIAI